MIIRTVFEGHYRALEEDFRRLVSGIDPSRDHHLRVTAAGAGQLERLRAIVLSERPGGVVSGIRFLPGMNHLARSLSPLPSPAETVSHGDRMLFSLHAMASLEAGEPLYQLRDNPDTAHSLGNFFEELFDHGITPELYQLTTMSLTREQTATERTVGRLLGIYGEIRGRHYSACADMALQGDIVSPGQDVFIFYGFYDLNPGQRRFLRRLFLGPGEVYWFSPVAGGSRWDSLYRRTRRFLEEAGAATSVRSDREVPMGEFAGFFEGLAGTGTLPVPPENLGITAVTGEMGACRTVLGRVEQLRRNGTPAERIAVVRRRSEGDCLVRMAVHEGVPVGEPLKVRLISMPEARFVLDLLQVIAGGLHRRHLESLVSWDLFLGDMRTAPSDVTETSIRHGVRMGYEEWGRWCTDHGGDTGLARLIRALIALRSGMVSPAPPQEFLRVLSDFLEEYTSLGGSGKLMEGMLGRKCFRSDAPVALEQFASALRTHCRSAEIELRQADPDGFRVMSPESLRGTLYSSVLIMDMEEGIYPRPQVEDPRLSEELRGRLQLSLKSQREEEDGFLLRQSGEGAGETLDIIYREQSSEGDEIPPSPFIAPLVHQTEVHSRRGRWYTRTSSSPIMQLLGGEHPGQTAGLHALEGRVPDDEVVLRSLEAEGSRMDFSGFDRFDGILGPGRMKVDRISPTMMEKYVRCPFAFMVSRLWEIDREEPAEVGSDPDPAVRGNLVHEAVERLVEVHGFEPTPEQVEAMVRKTAGSFGLGPLLGAEYLLEMFVRRQTGAIVSSLSALSERGWRYLGSELDLEGTLGPLRITGRIDLLLEDDGSRLVLLDLKTGRLPSASEVRKGLLYQLPFYYLLALQNYPELEVASVAYASISHRTPGKLEEWTPSMMEPIMGEVEERVGSLAAMIEEGIFPPAPTGRCGSCNFNGLCRLTPSERIRSKVGSDPGLEFFRERLSIR